MQQAKEADERRSAGTPIARVRYLTFTTLPLAYHHYLLSLRYMC